jgi:ribonucleoside-diphosphate reductase alpha chain
MSSFSIDSTSDEYSFTTNKVPTPYHPSSEKDSISIPRINTQLQVIKRTGQAVPFEASKIENAMTRAMLAVEGPQASGSERVRSLVKQITHDIVYRFERQFPDGGVITIEDIQDQVELGLMRQGLQKVARAYVLYREEHARQRASHQPVHTSDSQQEKITVIDQKGQPVALTLAEIYQQIVSACHGFSDVDPDYVFQQTKTHLYSGMKWIDVDSALLMTVRSLIEQEPNYSYVCAQILNQKLQKEVAQFYDLDVNNDNFYLDAFVQLIEQATSRQLLDNQLKQFDLSALAQALCPERDRQFSYLGLQTLYDRYFLHWQEQRIELPQTFFMRVAMGLAIKEDRPTERAIEFYHLLSTFDYMCSTPTLFNSGTCRPQLSSCYLTTIDDDLSAIYQSIAENAQLSKWAGGLGNDWTNVRALGAHIRGTNGKSQGVIPFLKVVNDTAVAVNQGGKRKGAVCAYLETWHLDIEDFLELRKNTGDERRRTHDMNTANWIPDLFIKRVINDESWTLFSPNEVPELHDLYGEAFERKYVEYETLAEQGHIHLFKKVSAKALWQKMLSMLFETGHPWITFKDPCNIRSPQQHLGRVHSSNLCTEITLNTSADEIAVCNLGSINLAQHIQNGQLDVERLRKTVTTAVRMLDNVIDINFYPVDKAQRSNLKHRPIGLGIMGFQDALYQMGISYASVEAVRFADHSMEQIAYLAIEASALLAKERGHYPSYEGSLWSQNVLPIDSLARLKDIRGADYCSFELASSLNWQPIRELIRQHGMRNSNVLAIAPTATISNIVGVSQSIEPTYQNLFVKSNLSGEFTVINRYLVEELKKLSLWDNVMLNDLKYFDGSVQSIERIPDELKERFITAFEMDPRWLVEAAARRQKWIDQAQSLNLYLAEPSGKMLSNLYLMAWSRGLKTTYYLRSLGATQQEKSVDMSTEQRLMNSTTSVAVCAIDDPECEACQ